MNVFSSIDSRKSDGIFGVSPELVLWALFFCYSTLTALLVQKLLLPLVDHNVFNVLANTTRPRIEDGLMTGEVRQKRLLKTYGAACVEGVAASPYSLLTVRRFCFCTTPGIPAARAS